MPHDLAHARATALNIITVGNELEFVVRGLKDDQQRGEDMDLLHSAMLVHTLADRCEAIEHWLPVLSLSRLTPFRVRPANDTYTSATDCVLGHLVLWRSCLCYGGFTRVYEAAKEALGAQRFELRQDPAGSGYPDLPAAVAVTTAYRRIRDKVKPGRQPADVAKLLAADAFRTAAGELQPALVKSHALDIADRLLLFWDLWPFVELEFQQAEGRMMLSARSGGRLHEPGEAEAVAEPKPAKTGRPGQFKTITGEFKRTTKDAVNEDIEKRFAPLSHEKRLDVTCGQLAADMCIPLERDSIIRKTPQWKALTDDRARRKQTKKWDRKVATAKVVRQGEGLGNERSDPGTRSSMA